MNFKKSLLSTILVVGFMLILGITPILASESTDITTSNNDDELVNKEETSFIEIRPAEEEEFVIQPQNLVGGGIATSKGHKGYAEIGVNLLAPGTRISSAHLTYTIYKNYGDMDPRNTRAYRTIRKNYFPNGAQFLNDEFNVNLAKGKYTFKVSGTIYSYSSSVPLPVRQFFSKPFTVK